MKFICSLLLFICASLPAQMQPWLTRSYDNSRSNWNPNETTLTQASIMTKGVSLVTKIPVCCDVRGIPPGGMPGGFCSGSSNGNDPNSAILVCSVPYGDANARIVNGRLLIYDPVHLAVDGSLKVLWDSQRWGISYIFNKFMPPVIDGDEIVLPDYSGSVLIFK
jgi:hypothetical protein